MIHVYVDGACSHNPGVGGWAAVIVTDDTVKAISGGSLKTTNNRMELYAVIRALERINRLFHHGKIVRQQVYIYSDSAYVINNIRNAYYWFKNNWIGTTGEIKNKDLWSRLLELLKQIDVSFVKVRGHSGIKYNEIADLLAKNEVIKLKERMKHR